jgi:crossover junction endodeoxyribonuclease RusA
MAGPGQEVRKLKVDVRGIPRPQGSMRALHRPGTSHVHLQYPAAVYAWRAQVQQAVVEAMTEPFLGACALHLGFDLPRPKDHYGTGRNAGCLKPSAPHRPTVMPDLDKLVRCVADACTDAGLWKDDAQVVEIATAKHYGSLPGVSIYVYELDEEEL